MIRFQVRCILVYMGTITIQLVAEEVRVAIARAGVTASDVAHAAGIPTATMSNRLKGRYPFTVDELVAVADFLKIDARTLIPRSPEFVPSPEKEAA